MILTLEMWEYFCEKQKVLDAAFMDNARWQPALKDRETAFLVEKGEFVNEFVRELRWWKHKWNDRDRILDEFADTIHFITGIENTQFEQGESFDAIGSFYRHNVESWDVTTMRTLLQHLIRSDNVHESFALSLYILKASGFTEEDIERAYNEKNKVNFNRIAEGY